MRRFADGHFVIHRRTRRLCSANARSSRSLGAGGLTRVSKKTARSRSERTSVSCSAMVRRAASVSAVMQKSVNLRRSSCAARSIRPGHLRGRDTSPRESLYHADGLRVDRAKILSAALRTLSGMPPHGNCPCVTLLVGRAGEDLEPVRQYALQASCRGPFTCPIGPALRQWLSTSDRHPNQCQY